MVRVLSAAVLIALVVTTIWWLPWWATAVLATICAGAAAWELAKLATAVGATVPSGVASIAAALACLGFLLDDPASPWHREHALSAVLLAIMVASALTVLAEGTPSPAALTRAGMLGFAPVYIGLPLGALAWTRVAVGPEALSWLILVMAASDSAQYYCGRAFGRRKLAPVISPGKTVEGAIGGLVVAGAVGAGASAWGLAGIPLATALVLAVILATSGLAGDLFESLLKRSANAKDSSPLIPGHGGILDRIDSYLFAAPMFYLYLRLVA